MVTNIILENYSMDYIAFNILCSRILRQLTTIKSQAPTKQLMHQLQNECRIDKNIINTELELMQKIVIHTNRIAVNNSLACIAFHYLYITSHTIGSQYKFVEQVNEPLKYHLSLTGKHMHFFHLSLSYNQTTMKYMDMAYKQFYF